VTGRQSASDEPEPYHRQWLHALEDEATVPSDEMQLARVYADYAPASGGQSTRVSARRMRHHTHMSFDAILKHTKWLVDHGWLVPQGEAANGQRKTYNLTFGFGGERRKPVPDPEGRRDERRRETSKRKREASAPEQSESADRSEYRNGEDAGDRSALRNATVPGVGTPPFRKAEHEQKEREEQNFSRRANSLHDQLAAVVPDATERETELVIENLAARPGVRSATAILRREIADGNGPSLVAEVRRQQSAAPSARSWCGQRDLCDERTGMLIDEYRQPGNQPCPRCHPTSPARGRPEHRPSSVGPVLALPAPLASAAEAPPEGQASTPCRYDQCRATGPVPGGQKYHDACAYIVGIKGRRDRDEAARRRALMERATAQGADATRPDGGHAA
jgi:hypothetical protein